MSALLLLVIAGLAVVVVGIAATVLIVFLTMRSRRKPGPDDED